MSHFLIRPIDLRADCASFSERMDLLMWKEMAKLDALGPRPCRGDAPCSSERNSAQLDGPALASSVAMTSSSAANLTTPTETATTAAARAGLPAAPRIDASPSLLQLVEPSQADSTAEACWAALQHAHQQCEAGASLLSGCMRCAETPRSLPTPLTRTQRAHGINKASTHTLSTHTRCTYTTP